MECRVSCGQSEELAPPVMSELMCGAGYQKHVLPLSVSQQQHVYYEAQQHVIQFTMIYLAVWSTLSLELFWNCHQPNPNCDTLFVLYSVFTCCKVYTCCNKSLYLLSHIKKCGVRGGKTFAQCCSLKILGIVGKY